MAEHIEHHHHSVLDAFNPLHNHLNWLLLAVPITIYFNLQHNVEMTFLFSMIAIMPLAFLMGHATEEIALRAGENLGGLLNATFGNAVEIIIAGLAIWTAARNPDQAVVMIQLVQASLIGSILGNLLLVLGLALLWGGYKHQTQSFNQEALSMNGSLLLLAVLALIIPAAAHHTGSNVTTDSILELSRYASLVLLLMYGLSLFFQFKTHSHLFDVSSEAEDKEEPKMTTKNAWILLLLATVLVGWMAEILVHSVDAAAEGWGLPTLFIGVILLPFFGNAAEHFTAVLVAGKNKMDLSLAIAIGSSVQIAVFVAPLMVAFAWVMKVDLSLEFGILETAATFMSVLVANFILNDGKTNWLEGVMLLACYTILALSFFGA
ncbi:MAG: calcium/proton exchanger [Euryarchaeota archaeon]|nr:calcium/proton exchanger [Euryarchaeota archaeon]|tara:strand:- start:134 stop:1264 length:1131 start_codon:yes stop_codon:yes gene_type:complete